MRTRVNLSLSLSLSLSLCLSLSLILSHSLPRSLNPLRGDQSACERPDSQSFILSDRAADRGASLLVHIVLGARVERTVETAHVCQ